MPRPTRFPLYIAAAVLAGFLVGFLWQYVRASGFRSELGRVEHELAFQSLEATLGAATIEAQRGGFETARQLASQFFSGLQQQIGRAPADTRPLLQDMLQRRDAMITALSRNDPQSGPLLSQLFVRYRAAFGRQIGPDGTTMPTPTVEPTDTM